MPTFRDLRNALIMVALGAYGWYLMLTLLMATIETGLRAVMVTP